MEEKLALVRFNNVGKSYFFSTDLDVHKGDKVVVETCLLYTSLHKIYFLHIIY